MLSLPKLFDVGLYFCRLLIIEKFQTASKSSPRAGYPCSLRPRAKTLRTEELFTVVLQWYLGCALPTVSAFVRASAGTLPSLTSKRSRLAEQHPKRRWGTPPAITSRRCRRRLRTESGATSGSVRGPARPWTNKSRGQLRSSSTARPPRQRQRLPPANNTPGWRRLVRGPP